MKILAVDDEPTSLLILSATLASLGHEVIEARGGEEALALLKLQQIPIVVSDCMMPGVDGLELCRRIREVSPAKYTFVILISVAGSKGDYLRGMEAGADDFIVKPLDPEQLASRLRVAQRILKLQSEVRQLSGLLPICCYCKKVRDDKDYWQNVESYITSKSDARFSHGICPSCFDRHVQPQLDSFKDQQV